MLTISSITPGVDGPGHHRVHRLGRDRRRLDDPTLELVSHGGREQPARADDDAGGLVRSRTGQRQLVGERLDAGVHRPLLGVADRGHGGQVVGQAGDQPDGAGDSGGGGVLHEPIGSHHAGHGRFDGRVGQPLPGGADVVDPLGDGVGESRLAGHPGGSAGSIGEVAHVGHGDTVVTVDATPTARLVLDPSPGGPEQGDSTCRWQRRS